MDPSCLVSRFLAGGDGLIVWELFCWHTMGIMVLGLFLNGTFKNILYKRETNKKRNETKTMGGEMLYKVTGLQI